MGMSVGGGKGGVKAEPNVVPMIDIMLVLLIIFMIVVPTIQAGFNAVPPQGVNLKSHPEEETDKVLGIDADGKYYLDKKPIRNEQLYDHLKSTYDVRTEDKILYIKAHRDLQYQKVLDAMDIAARAGVRVVGAISEQRPGTESTVEGDNPQPATKRP
jgi:biopolymer transport protein TolR